LDFAGKGRVKRDALWITDFLGAVLTVCKRTAAKRAISCNGVPSTFDAPTVGFVFTDIPGNVIGQGDLPAGDFRQTLEAATVSPDIHPSLRLRFVPTVLCLNLLDQIRVIPDRRQFGIIEFSPTAAEVAQRDPQR
jgi:hypothetical protein